MKETAVFDKAFVKKSAWIGARDFCRDLAEHLGGFARRKFTTFETRQEALAWLVKD
jgi:hypothetical protein